MRTTASSWKVANEYKPHAELYFYLMIKEPSVELGTLSMRRV